MQGTGASAGCPTTGGREDVLSATAAVWLNGRARATDANGRAVAADWSTGAVGLIGLSYDGTLAEAVAARGEGLRTIVPEGAISSWYDYARDQRIANPDSRPVRMWFGPADSSAVGTLGDTPATSATQTFTDGPTRYAAEMIANPSAGAPSRLAYLAAPLPPRAEGQADQAADRHARFHRRQEP